MIRIPTWTLLLALVLTPLASAQQDGAYSGRVGATDFPVDCEEAAKRHAERGLALLHHMTYDAADREFAAAAEADPDCALAYWGRAMSYVHPLWSDPPTEETFARGRELLAKAREHAEGDAWETAYVDALAGYYDAGWSRDEKANLAAFARGWGEVHERFPEDREAAALYALALLGTADPGDKTYATQKRAGALAERVLAERPDHPGAHHYVIHAYDYPPLAEDALEVARHYGEVAPEVPHALHMPSHIFTRLGLWEESIDWNARSAAAARERPMGDAISLHYLHALDYLAYAHLQRAEDAQAERVLREMRTLEGPFLHEIATPYTLAAVPARLALERRRWADAAALAPRTPAAYPWDEVPAMEALTHFARALGAAHTGDRETAATALARLGELREAAAETSPYWAQQVEIQQLAARAWLEHETGDSERGLELMRRAAELESSTEKHPVTPGEVLPARELLADMLLDLGRHEEALEQYEAALDRSPNRFNSLYGAGRAAELAGDRELAESYYAALVELAEDADPGREEIAHAREFLAEGSG